MSIVKKTIATIPAKPDRNAGLKLAVASITKQFGSGAIMSLGETTALDIEAISTGSAIIDRAIGIGGLPRGRIVEIYGPESSGKTTFCLSVIAEVQRNGGLAAFIDVEHAVDPKYAKVVGVNLDDLLISQPDSGEDALNIMEALIRSNVVDVIVLDSVAALITKQELDGEMGAATMGATARLMSQAMRRLTAAVSKANCVVIFTNQIREKIGVMFGSPETQPGGRALKFFSSVRIDIRRKDQLKTPEGRVIGNRTKIKIVKNKVAPPFAECEFDIRYDRGIDEVGGLVELGLQLGILQKKGAWISHNGSLIGNGADASRTELIANKSLFTAINDEVRAKVLAERTKVAVVAGEGAPPPVDDVPALTPEEEAALAAA